MCKAIARKTLILLLFICFALGCGGAAANAKNETTRVSGTPGASVVFMTTNITPEGLIALYGALGREAKGTVAVKVSTGEPGGTNFLSPALIKRLVQSVNGVIVECNTAYNGKRSTTEEHLKTAKDHGFIDIANVDIMDAEGSIALPVRNGVYLKENFVGANFTNYDFYIILSHFKGHAMGGFGGAIKNSSIGIASREGKSWIHSAGKSKTSPWGGAQNAFLASMAEAATSIADYLGENVLYINVMNRLSVDCDCSAHPAEPDMHDIGALASLDPVALDKACVDLVYNAPDGGALIERIESRNGILTLTKAAELGLGNLEYELVRLDDNKR